MLGKIMMLPPVQRAWAFAAVQHNGQLYPGTALPYLVHIGNVVWELLPALEKQGNESGFDAELAVCCALLHDTLEDTVTSLDEVRSFFGDQIAAGVSALTKDKNLPKHEAMQDSLERIKRQPREVWMVKLSDRIANLRIPPDHWSVEKCRVYAQEGQTILDALEPASAMLSGRLASCIAAWMSGHFSQSATSTR